MPVPIHTLNILKTFFPCFFVDNGANRSQRHIHISGYLRHRCGTFRYLFAYLLHLSYCELMELVVLTIRMSTFCNFIMHVIHLSTQKQMMRVYTSGVIATMTYYHAVRYLPIYHFPHYPICSNVFSFVFEFCISITTFCSKPLPALIRIFVGRNFSPKLIFNRDFGLMSHHKHIGIPLNLSYARIRLIGWFRFFTTSAMTITKKFRFGVITSCHDVPLYTSYLHYSMDYV